MPISPRSIITAGKAAALAGLLCVSACHHARPVAKPPAPDTAAAPAITKQVQRDRPPVSQIAPLKHRIDSLSQVIEWEEKELRGSRTEVDVYKSLLLQADQNYLVMTRSLNSAEQKADAITGLLEAQEEFQRSRQQKVVTPEILGYCQSLLQTATEEKENKNYAGALYCARRVVRIIKYFSAIK